MTATTLERVIDEFTQIVDAMPAGYVYSPPPGTSGGCLYVHGGSAGNPLEPGCIIAHWLHRFHQVPLDALAHVEGLAAPNMLVRLLATGVLPFDLLDDLSGAQVLKFLQALQSFQDRGRTWRDALEAAYELVTTPPMSFLLGPRWPVEKQSEVAGAPG